MELMERIRLAEYTFPKHFTDYVERPWGILFWNSTNKQSYDSNHAVLFPDRIAGLPQVLTEVRDFYREKGSVPIIYHPFVPDYLKANQAVFESCGYQVHLEPSHTVMTLQAENRLKKGGELDIRLITQWDERIAADIFIPNEEEYEVPVIQNSMKQRDSYIFVGYLSGRAVGTVYFHRTPYDVTRFDFINVAKAMRGHGYGRELLCRAVDFCREKALPNCYQWPDNETSRRMCEEAGFRPLFSMEAGWADSVAVDG